jgi:hypothetical protein
MLCRISS